VSSIVFLFSSSSLDLARRCGTGLRYYPLVFVEQVTTVFIQTLVTNEMNGAVQKHRVLL
jgi:hypothetical protein